MAVGGGKLSPCNRSLIAIVLGANLGVGVTLPFLNLFEVPSG